MPLNEHEFYEAHLQVTHALHTDQWKNETCFIVGGGPSLRNFDFTVLRNRNTIGINKAFIAFPPSVIYCNDRSFYIKLMNKEYSELYRNLWLALRVPKIFPVPEVPFEPLEGDNVYFVRRLCSRVVSDSLERGIFPGENSGLGAIMLAHALGANPICLLGFDGRITDSTHWHEGYADMPNDLTEGKLKVFRRGFDHVAPFLRGKGTHVLNLNLDSGIQCFEKVDPREVLPI